MNATTDSSRICIYAKIEINAVVDLGHIISWSSSRTTTPGSCSHRPVGSNVGGLHNCSNVVNVAMANKSVTTRSNENGNSFNAHNQGNSFRSSTCVGLPRLETRNLVGSCEKVTKEMTSRVHV